MANPTQVKTSAAPAAPKAQAVSTTNHNAQKQAEAQQCRNRIANRQRVRVATERKRDDEIEQVRARFVTALTQLQEADDRDKARLAELEPAAGAARPPPGSPPPKAPAGIQDHVEPEDEPMSADVVARLVNATADAIMRIPPEQAAKRSIGEILNAFPAIKILAAAHAVRALAARKPPAPPDGTDDEDLPTQQKAADLIRALTATRPEATTPKTPSL